MSTRDVDPDAFAYVCFQAFLSIFGIKKGRLETIKKSLATTGKMIAVVFIFYSFDIFRDKKVAG